MANNYEELVRKLRSHNGWALNETLDQAADAIEELLHAAKKMHTWISLNTGDEQKAYDECGLSDEMNAALGYGGQFEIKVNDDV